MGKGKILNWDYKVTAKNEGLVINTVEGDDVTSFPIDKARIRSLWIWVTGAACATIGFGWAIETNVHLSCALVMTATAGVCFTGVFNVSRIIYPHRRN